MIKNLYTDPSKVKMIEEMLLSCLENMKSQNVLHLDDEEE